MKKGVEFCPICARETTHRYKRKSFKLKRKGETYTSIVLPVKCLTCGHLQGGDRRRETAKKNIFMTFNK